MTSNAAAYRRCANQTLSSAATPKEPRNIRIPTGPRGYSTCALCARARKIVARVVRDQDRINQGKYVQSAAL
jgi:hypothetical protein